MVGFPSTPIWQRSGSSPAASASGGSDGEPGLVALCCKGVPSGGGGALFLRHSRTAFTGVPIGTDWKGAASMFVLAVLYCSCFMVTLAPRFVEKEKLQNRKRRRSHKRNKNRSRGKRSNNSNTHITTNTLTSHPLRNPPHPHPSPSQKPSHSQWKENYSKYVYKPPLLNPSFHV